MSEEPGRRAANKRDTTDAIKDAAHHLFAAKGYEATSVREIAAAAGVGERTFYRYFDGKEGLLADEVQRWIDLLQAAILDRPAEESPLTAVQRALMSIGQRLGDGARNRPIWLFTDQPRPFELLQKSAPRPLLRFEEGVARALQARVGDPVDARSRYAMEVVARTSVAVIRSAAIRHRELLAADSSLAPPVQQLVSEAFDFLRTTILLDNDSMQSSA